MLVALAIGALACTVSDCLTREPAVITHQNDRTRSFGFYGRLPACQGLGPLQYLSCVSRSADQDAISLLRRPPGREAAAIKSSAAWLKTIISKEPAFCSLCARTPHTASKTTLSTSPSMLARFWCRALSNLLRKAAPAAAESRISRLGSHTMPETTERPGKFGGDGSNFMGSCRENCMASVNSVDDRSACNEIPASCRSCVPNASTASAVYCFGTS